ncbi:MAG TPA: HAMP domain-containing sensor histidine kinase [Anaeromyxobacteraceae bacterium]
MLVESLEAMRQVVERQVVAPALALAARLGEDRRRAQARLSLLSKLGDLAATLGYKDVLAAVARLSIPELADWCFVDVLEGGEVRIAEVACGDAAGAALANALPRLPIHHPARRRLPAAQALRSGRPVLISEYTLDLLREQTDGEYFELLRGIKARSAIAIPLDLGSSLAVMTFLVTSQSERRYGPQDLALAEELARRAGQIVEQKRTQHELAQALAFREQVMGILGHDLRNPLGAVRVLASLLLRRNELPEDVRESLAAIDRAGKRMLELIETLLDFSESRFKGRLPIAPVPTDMHELCRGVVEELLAAEPHVAIEIDGQGDARGSWDPARLAQVVSNLVGNAVKHGARGAPVRLLVRGDDEEVILEVRNEGPAIAPELLPVLFEPFRRGPAAREASSHARGLGLGLYIVRQIVDAHAGTIAVDSTAEQGTTFTVRLPRARGVRTADAEGRHAAWEGGAPAGA